MILKLDLDLIKIYLHAKNEVLSYSSSKVIVQTDRHSDRQTDTQTDTDRYTDTSESITYPDGRYLWSWSGLVQFTEFLVTYTAVYAGIVHSVSLELKKMIMKTMDC